MGIIKAAKNMLSNSLADQWLEVVEPSDMSDQTIFCEGVKTRRGENTKGTKGLISNGSVIHVYPNQFMMIVDGGKVVDYTAEEGYYTVDNSSMPSVFNGEFGGTLKESFNRIKFGGETPNRQQVFYINLQEIKGIKFGTPNPINYFDSFYNAELFLRTFGTYSIKVTDPLKFYEEVIPKDASKVKFADIDDQYMSEFLTALSSSINQMSANGIRVSFMPSKALELSKYMQEALDEEWKNGRGMEIIAVGISSISYTEDSQELINMRNKGAMMGDPTVREGFVQSTIAEGLKDAASNENGAIAGFMGMGLGMNATGGFMQSASQNNMRQMEMQRQNPQVSESAANQTISNSTWKCACGSINTGKFCSNCGSKKPEETTWKCTCGTVNTGKFCSECGNKKPENEYWECSCGAKNKGKFCQECGKPRE